MPAFLFKRLLNAAGVMLAVAFLAFLIFRFVGDPVELMLNEQASQQQRDELRVRLGLDKGFVLQYATFVGNAVRGDFGISYRNQQDVFTLISERFPATFELVLVATFLSLAVGVPLGVYTAIRRDSFIAKTLQFVSVLGVSLPSFALGILFILIFSVTLDWFPFVSRSDIAATGWRWYWEMFRQAIMPITVLGLFQAASYTRYVRSAVLDVIRLDYVTTARAKGLSERRVTLRHITRNALIPVVTLVALQMPAVFGGAIVTEQIFRIPGIGSLLIDAILANDTPVIMAVTFVFSCLVVMFNLIADLLYGWLDPRISFG